MVSKEERRMTMYKRS